MRLLSELDRYRRHDLELARANCYGDDYVGIFVIPSPTDRKPLRAVVSALEGWDHVSISHPKRIPNYIEMDAMKRLFFRDDECAMQLHVPASDHVNNHSRCLHLWRPHVEPIPRPPAHFVGVASMSPADMTAAIRAADADGIPRHVLQDALIEKALAERSAP